MTAADMLRGNADLEAGPYLAAECERGGQSYMADWTDWRGFPKEI